MAFGGGIANKAAAGKDATSKNREASGQDAGASCDGADHGRWLAAMRRGDFAAAFAVNDAVLARRDPATRDDPRLPYHARWVWDGRAVDGAEILVRCYHGLGDTVQFARYLPALRARAASVALECQPELVALLASAGIADRIIPFDPSHPAPPTACGIEIMELAHALRLPPERVPVPYLCVAQSQVAALRRRLGVAGQTLRVGLCWQSGGWGGARSVPLEALAAACAGADLALVSLQRGAAAAEAQTLHAPRFLNPDDRSCDVLATASLIGALDVVVTVDTFVAHLAGALGTPVWLLLEVEADWRWMAERNDSPWYPTMRLYRQSIAGDWRAPLARLRNDLALRASLRSAAR